MGDVTRAEMVYRSPVKQPVGQPPGLVIAVPVGTKALKHVFPIPGCSDEKCSCPNHGQSVQTSVLTSLMVPFQWALNVHNVMMPMNLQAYFLTQTGTLSAQARNEMTQRALEIGSKYIFYWDDDVILPPLTFYTMHTILEQNPDIAAVTGVYVTREDPPVPVLYKDHLVGPYWGFSISPEDPPEDIWGAGAGCIMARLSDVAQMKEPYWSDEQIVSPGVNPVVWGHDIRFFRNLREATGKRTVVQGSLLCRHWDAERGKFYDLPRDCEPRRRAGLPAIQHRELEVCPRLDSDVIWRLLRDSHDQQRVFLVPKPVQEQEEVHAVLSPHFSSVSVVSVDNHWLAACEGLRNGNGSKSAVGQGQCRDVDFGRKRDHAPECCGCESDPDRGGLDPAQVAAQE